ncbi:hypothetical protein [Candidatus Competibacter denitrificans]|uniref:hypothetical protein n=1 Tax=Candidatus Competibacter denitrificans TaxID=1400862 RepID=UPI00069CCE4E|nr:hypothetical protein [Candidatus Competibacter denitrificans]
MQLKFLDLVGPGALVVAQHLHHIAPIIFFTDKEQTLVVLRLAAGLDDVAGRVGLDERDSVTEGGEIFLRDDANARRPQFLLTESPIILQPVSVRGAADY